MPSALPAKPTPKATPVPLLPHVGAFSPSGDSFFPSVPAVPVPIGNRTYRIGCGLRGFFLTPTDAIRVPDTVYGVDHSVRILTSWKERAERGESMGVWLNGEKGSGKTMMAGRLSQLVAALDIPTIIVSEPHHGPQFEEFLGHIGCACIVFDEFEKVYHDKDEQAAMLTVFAGTVMSRHLWVLTTNDSGAVSTAMRNRPTRMRYFMDFTGVADDVIDEYLAKNLDADNAMRTEIKSALASVPTCNFDVLQTVVEEYNRFKMPIYDLLDILNVSRDGAGMWDVTFEGIFQGKKVLKASGYYNGDLGRNLRNPSWRDHIALNWSYKTSAKGAVKDDCDSIMMSATSKWAIDDNGDIAIIIDNNSGEYAQKGVLTAKRAKPISYSWRKGGE